MGSSLELFLTGESHYSKIEPMQKKLKVNSKIFIVRGKGSVKARIKAAIPWTSAIAHIDIAGGMAHIPAT
ncbi:MULTISPECIES: hypothetical protein [unclassified Rhizobium]|uniref:hypothetical protein n=1 Tax=unclassified Rhizobium TaxID=2613769 RepID=UPI0012E3937B|nr:MULTISPECIES: hypothetical protein [unclassified Rhizobium]